MVSAGYSQSNSQGNHVYFMQKALELARNSPPKPTNYRVGALLVDGDLNTIISSGFTLECEGNTHAEQCCLIKIAKEYGVNEDKLAIALPDNTVLYTTVEPCSRRLSGAVPCVDRILHLKNKIKTVYVGLREPDTFINENIGKCKLESAGIMVSVVSGLETEIHSVATAGHREEKQAEINIMTTS